MPRYPEDAPDWIEEDPRDHRICTWNFKNTGDEDRCNPNVKDEPGALCRFCGGQLVYLGTLANLIYDACRDCGAQFKRPAEAVNEGT